MAFSPAITLLKFANAKLVSKAASTFVFANDGSNGAIPPDGSCKVALWGTMPVKRCASAVALCVALRAEGTAL